MSPQRQQCKYILSALVEYPRRWYYVKLAALYEDQYSAQSIHTRIPPAASFQEMDLGAAAAGKNA